MKFDAEVKREIIKIAIGCAVCTVITMTVFCAVGQLDYTALLGGVLGFVMAFGNFFTMSVGVIRALETGDEVSAKLKLRLSYVLRTAVQIGIIALALALDFIGWVPVALAVFYPRLTVTACDLWKTFAKKNAPAEKKAEFTPLGKEAERPDEFEKFVSGFYKGEQTKE